MELPALMKTAAVVTVSDGVSAGTRLDESGEALVSRLRDAGFDVAHQTVVSDDAGAIAMAVRGYVDQVNLLVTTGGTGFGRHPRAPDQALRSLLRR